MTETDPEFRYLLNRMDSVEREAFGARLLDDQELFDRVLEAENELYDGYARGTLSSEVRQAFERMVAGDRKKLTFARALDRKQRVRKPIRRLAVFAASVLVLVAAASTLLVLRRGGDQPAAKRSRAPVVAQLVLSTGATRADGELPRLSVPGGADEVELRMPLNAAPGLAAVDLRSRRGAIWRGELNTDAMVVLRLPVRDLPPGLYEFTVSRSGKPIGFASFYLSSQ